MNTTLRKNVEPADAEDRADLLRLQVKAELAKKVQEAPSQSTPNKRSGSSSSAGSPCKVACGTNVGRVSPKTRRGLQLLSAIPEMCEVGGE